MDEAIVKTLIEQKTLSALNVALLSGAVSFVTFVVVTFVKHLFENRSLKRKLKTEHTFDQRKQIKAVLAKNKVHLLTACEDLNHRFWNLANSHPNKWLDVGGNYATEEYVFHSFCYRILAVFAWIKIIQKEMIFLDTTIATKDDLEFIKFLRVFPEVFVDLFYLVGKNAGIIHSNDNIYKNRFEQFPDTIILKEGIQDYASFISDLSLHQSKLSELFQYIDNVSPDDSRYRWDRLNLLYLTTLIFLNNYGYDYQQMNDDVLKEAIALPRTSRYLKKYFVLLEAYKLSDNREVKKLRRIANEVL